MKSNKLFHTIRNFLLLTLVVLLIPFPVLAESSDTQTEVPQVEAPVLENATTATSKSITVKWNKVDGADGYYVYRKTTTGSWKKIATIKKGSTLSYKDSKAKSTYYYSVSAYDKINKKTYTSEKSNAVKSTVLSKPTMYSVKQVESTNSVKVSWKKVSKATKYELYQRIGSKGDWNLVTVTDADTRSYTTKLEIGTTYYWKVRPIVEYDGDTTTGSYSSYKKYCFSMPKFRYELLTSPNYSNKSSIKIRIKNLGSSSLYFYSTDALVQDGNADFYELKQVTSKGKKLSSAKVSSKKTKTLYYKVVDGKAYYTDDTILQFKFKYDGLYYYFQTYADASENGFFPAGWDIVQ